MVLFCWQGFKLTKQSMWRSTLNWQAVSTSRYPPGHFLASKQGFGLQFAQIGRDASAAVSVLNNAIFCAFCLCNLVIFVLQLMLIIASFTFWCTSGCSSQINYTEKEFGDCWINWSCWKTWFQQGEEVLQARGKWQYGSNCPTPGGGKVDLF